jgi:energy-coupling factor transporter ATP-binding protein EcfA2
VTALTPFQIKQLTARRDALLPEWELLTEKVKRLRMALIIETGAAEKFKLEQQILAEDEKLTKLAAELEEIEQKLSQTPTLSPPTNNSDPSDRIQQNVKGDGNQIIGQVTGGNVFNIAGNVNILPQKSIDQTTPQIDWLDRSRQLLQAQKHLTTNCLLNKSNRNLDDIHVPLGLIERKERPKVKEEPSPEQGSQLYQTEYTETKRFEHEAFLADVVGKPAGGKQIAIIGEPGAGKTTILTKIGAWLIQQAEQQPPAPLVVAWISLADVGDRRLQEYIRDEWLQKVCEDNFDAAWEDWKGLRQQGRVWLLLDGLDEMSGDALAAIHRDLGLAWAQNLRVVVTCRLNQWETASNNLVNSFDVYRTLDYSYQTSQGDDQVKAFISKWFADDEKVATQIRTELDAPGKERIKDLVKNPLRLTLLCASWERDTQALPETQADLYRGFVNYLYNWKAAEFSDEVKLKQELDLALGELAKAGLNRQPINDGAVRRFRFTASEISKLWKDRSDTLLPAADKLGWLNVVGEESGEAVYAFYHPTFQEYFAACSIDDWDYFLPRAHIDRPVPCQGEIVPTYRVFEKQWREVIFLWIGRDSINLEDKNNFVNRIAGFKDGCGDYKFYVERSQYLISVLIGMILPKATKQQNECCKKEDEDDLNEIRELLTNGNSIDEDKLNDLINSILLKDPCWEDNSIKYFLDERIDTGIKIGRLIRQYESNHFFLKTMIQYIDRDNLSEEQKMCLAAALITFDPTHQKAVNTFDDILSNSTDSHHKVLIVKILFDIDRTKSINEFEKILRDSSLSQIEMDFCFNPIIRLCKDELIIIKAIVDLIKSNPLKQVRSTCIRLLAYISNDVDQESTDVLIEILTSKEYDNDLKNSALRTIGMMNNKHPAVVKILYQLVGYENDDNSLLAARILSSWIGYPNFYTLCHPN